MKLNAFYKDIRREIFHTVGRFVSIFLIVAIGCGFFAGIKATMPYMKDTAADYFKDNNLMDIRLQSTIGIKSSDVQALTTLDFVKGIMPSYSKDVFYNYNDENVVLKAMSYADRYKDNDALNKLVVLEGRLPKSSGECVVERKVSSPETFKIGESLTFSSVSEDTEITDSLVRDTYKIVGIVASPLYIGYQRDNTTAGNGKIISNIFLLEEDFIDDYYSELYISVNGLDAYEPFSDKYKDEVDKYSKIAASALEESVLGRFNEYKTDAEQDIKKAKSDIDNLQNIIKSDTQALKVMETNLNKDISDLQRQISNEESDARLILLEAGVINKQDSLNQIERLINAREQGDVSVDNEYKQKIEESKAQVKESEKSLSEISKPKIYTSSRFNSDDYSSFESDSEKVNMIAKVFPVFFILVTALVCLTTMTRMVEENRMQIGAYKALGYSSFKIAMKYLIYAAVPTVLGSVAGVTAGLQVFPKIIYNSYKILYNIPKLNTPFLPWYCIGCTAVALICVLITVVYAIIMELKAVPSELMRPKFPPVGKRVFLENIGFLWKRFGFLTKVTFRNLLRYKKRFLMTVVGIAGCTALIVTAFGLKHSIGIIIDKQFDNVFKYDAAVMVNPSKAESVTTAENELQNINGVSDSIPLCIERFTASIKDRSPNSVTVISTDAPDRITQFISMQNRKSGKKLSIENDGVIVTEKLCMLLDLNVGDTLSLNDDDGNVYKMKISGITENYASHYVYISNTLFEEIFGRQAAFNSFYIHTSDEVFENEIAKEIVANDNFLGVSYISELGESFSDTLDSLNSIVILLIVCAGALAIVVLYNLSNINITERKREIATIKVLGFYNGEVSAYIIRENVLSTIIGIIIGWVIGVFLHHFVVTTSEVDIVMFDRNLVWWAYVSAFVLTVIFSAIVNFVLYFKLKKIEMVESLKSVE